MRLRPLTEAECYARCYGDHARDTVSVVRLRPDERRRAPLLRESVQELFSVHVDRHSEDRAA